MTSSEFGNLKPIKMEEKRINNFSSFSYSLHSGTIPGHALGNIVGGSLKVQLQVDLLHKLLSKDELIAKMKLIDFVVSIRYGGSIPNDPNMIDSNKNDEYIRSNYLNFTEYFPAFGASAIILPTSIAKSSINSIQNVGEMENDDDANFNQELNRHYRSNKPTLNSIIFTWKIKNPVLPSLSSSNGDLMIRVDAIDLFSSFDDGIHN
jgi:hypothetical protein